jgi:hypothetical protein
LYQWASFSSEQKKIGITKSADSLDKATREKSKYDTFSGAIDEVKPPELPAKRSVKPKHRRKPLPSEMYDNSSFENQSTLPLRDSVREPIKESFRESLHPAIFQIDQSKAVLRDRLHKELREKYSASTKLLKAKPPRVPSFSNRPPLRSPNSTESFLKVQSNESLEMRPLPSPRTSKPSKFSEDDDDDGPDPTYATIQPKNKSPRVSTNLPLGRLSKEDLLSLSHRTESEIHEFLNGKAGSRQNSKTDPPWYW